MQNIYRSLLLVLAGATQKELARQVRYLTIENQLPPQQLPRRLTLTMQERNRLVRFGVKLGRAIDHLVSIVHPSTLKRWIREDRHGRKKVAVPRGRRRTPEQIRRLILKLAKENNWGYTRILGELKKLGVRSVSRNTVKNILKTNGLDPGPQRGVGTWDEFLKIHAASLWQCDFFSKRVLTPKGFRELFVVVFLHVGTRRVFLTPATEHPNEAWIIEQAEAFLHHARSKNLDTKLIMHDRDAKFTARFDAALKKKDGLEVRRSAYRAPNTVAFVERFVQSIKQECLDYFVVLGQRHMDYLCQEFVEHYHAERPHQGLDNEVPKLSGKKRQGPDLIPLADAACRSRLGGLLKHYHRKAA